MWRQPLAAVTALGGATATRQYYYYHRAFDCNIIVVVIRAHFERHNAFSKTNRSRRGLTLCVCVCFFSSKYMIIIIILPDCQKFRFDRPPPRLVRTWSSEQKSTTPIDSPNLRGRTSFPPVRIMCLVTVRLEKQIYRNTRVIDTTGGLQTP